MLRLETAGLLVLLGSLNLELGILPSNALATSTVEGYGESLTCRDQLDRILTAMGHPAQYVILYDMNTHAYYLNIAPAHRLVTGPDGKPIVAPL